MKTLKLCLIFMAISSVAYANSGDGGWTSTGGGEFITTQNNPWFMGPTPVKWCIDHGGEDKFSLPLEDAKNEIENGIAVIVSQLKSINQNPGRIQASTTELLFSKCGARPSRDAWEPFCDYDDDSTDVLHVSDKYVYTSACADADIEFILGNYDNPKVKQYIKDITLEKFKKYAAIAIRTEYSQKTLRGKGFIYLAADKGLIQYSGLRNLKFGQSTFWNNNNKVSPDALIPKEIYGNHGVSDDVELSTLKLKDYTMGPMLPIISHEIAHTLGVSHTTFKNIMNENYPAKIIADGLTFTGNFERESKILSKGLIESNLDRKIDFEWTYDEHSNRRLGPSDRDYARIQGSDINTFVAMIDENKNSPTDRVVTFKFKNKPKTLSFITLSYRKKGSLTYNYEKSFPITYESDCHVSLNQNQIRLKVENSNNTIDTINLINFDDTNFCGKIHLEQMPKQGFDDEGRTISFNLFHNYFKGINQLELFSTKYDGTPDKFTIDLTDSVFLESNNSILPFFVFKKPVKLTNTINFHSKKN